MAAMNSMTCRLVMLNVMYIYIYIYIYRISSKISSPEETQKFRHLVGLEEFYYLLNKATKP